jgi:hypothetical protein
VRVCRGGVASRAANDGAYFGTTFPHLFFMTFEAQVNSIFQSRAPSRPVALVAWSSVAWYGSAWCNRWRVAGGSVV